MDYRRANRRKSRKSCYFGFLLNFIKLFFLNRIKFHFIVSAYIYLIVNTWTSNMYTNNMAAAATRDTTTVSVFLFYIFGFKCCRNTCKVYCNFNTSSSYAPAQYIVFLTFKVLRNFLGSNILWSITEHELEHEFIWQAIVLNS